MAAAVDRFNGKRKKFAAPELPCVLGGVDKRPVCQDTGSGANHEVSEGECAFFVVHAVKMGTSCLR